MRQRCIVRYVLFLLFIVSSLCAAGQQKITKEEWGRLIQSLEAENWLSSESLSSAYLARYTDSTDTTGVAATVRYMYIRSVAARLAAKQYTQEEALKKVKSMQGKEVLTPVLQFKAKGMFNLVKLSEDSLSLFICGANSNATEIHTFEIYEPADPVIMLHATELEDKHVRLYARIATIKSGGVAFPHLELCLTNTEVYVDEQ